MFAAWSGSCKQHQLRDLGEVILERCRILMPEVREDEESTAPS